MFSENKFMQRGLVGNKRRKYLNKKEILSLLHKHKHLTIKDISRMVGLSVPTAMGILSELIDSRFVEIDGVGAYSGGRKPTMYSLSESSFYALACVVGRYKTKIAILNLQNTIISTVSEFEISMDAAFFIDTIYDKAVELAHASNISFDQIIAFGIAIPGLIDENLGINYTIKAAENRNLKKKLSEKFDGFIYINNDARMQALGEYVFGAAKEYKSAVVINWNWGIGMGIILDGNLYNGSLGFAGELSHIQMVENGRLCICGKRGCLETIASASALIYKAKKAVNSDKVSQLTQKFKDRIDNLSVEDIIASANQGDELSMKLLSELAYNLGKGISTVIQLINPDVVVLRGPLVKAKNFLLPSIQNSLNKHCLSQINNNTKVIFSNELEHSGLLGLTTIMYQKVFSKIIINQKMNL